MASMERMVPLRGLLWPRKQCKATRLSKTSRRRHCSVSWGWYWVQGMCSSYWMSRYSLKFSNFHWHMQMLCDLFHHSTISSLQLSGKHGDDGLNVLCPAAWDLEWGDVLVVSKPSMAPSSVQENFLSLRIAYQLLVQVKFEPFFSHYHHKKMYI